jgi:hypothetical protein
MTYEQRKDLQPGNCKRACGGHPQTFEQMLQVLQAHEQQKVKPGRPPTLSLENQLLMALQYWHEYRTYFHTWALMGADRVCCVPYGPED